MKNLSTPLNVQFWAKNLLKKYLWRNESLHITHVNCTNVQMVEFWKRNFKNDAIGKYLYVWGPSINDVTHFLRFLTPPSSLVTHFTKKAYGVTLLFGRCPLLPKWETAPLLKKIIVCSLKNLLSWSSVFKNI